MNCVDSKSCLDPGHPTEDRPYSRRRCPCEPCESDFTPRKNTIFEHSVETEQTPRAFPPVLFEPLAFELVSMAAKAMLMSHECSSKLLCETVNLESRLRSLACNMPFLPAVRS